MGPVSVAVDGSYSLSISLSDCLEEKPRRIKEKAAGWLMAKGAGSEAASGTDGCWLQHPRVVGMGASTASGVTELIGNVSPAAGCDHTAFPRKTSQVEDYAAERGNHVAQCKGAVEIRNNAEP